MVIEFLADHPELVQQVATWFFEEWGHQRPNNSVDLVEKRLHERMNREHLPIAYVAFQDSIPIGSASLIVQELPAHPQYLHWLASVYVKVEYRRQGIGAEIISAVVEQAGKLGLRQQDQKRSLEDPNLQKKYFL